MKKYDYGLKLETDGILHWKKTFKVVILKKKLFKSDYTRF